MVGKGGKFEDRCAICQEWKITVMDHDHLSGECRGRLCERCNVMLGWFERNSANIAAYLSAWTTGIAYSTHRSAHKERLPVRMESRRRRQREQYRTDPEYRMKRNERTKAINRARWAADPDYRARRTLEIRLQKLWKEVMPNAAR